MSAVIPDPALTDWVPLWSLGAPSGLVMVEDKLLAADGVIDFQNIPATYKHLMLVASLRGTAAVIMVDAKLQLNGSAATIYDSIVAALAAAYAGTGLVDSTSGWLGYAYAASGPPADDFSPFVIHLPDYANTARNKGWNSQGVHHSSSQYGIAQAGGVWKSLAAVNRIALIPSSGTWKAGSRATLYALTDVTAPPALAGAFSGARVYRVANQTLVGTTWVPILFTHERFDTDSYHDTGSNTSRLTIAVPGKYMVVGQAKSSSFSLSLRLVVNGTNVIAENGASLASQTMDVSSVWDFGAGDYVELQGFLSAGSDVVAAANYTPELSIVRL